MVSNWILRRNDQIGCPIFTPIDLAEARLLGSRNEVSDARASEG
jgi:hypothetical protein